MSKCLLTAIRKHNAEIISWTAGGPGRMAPLLTEDLFYWNARRVFDADDLALWVSLEKAPRTPPLVDPEYDALVEG